MWHAILPGSRILRQGLAAIAISHHRVELRLLYAKTATVIEQQLIVIFPHGTVWIDTTRMQHVTIVIVL